MPLIEITTRTQPLQREINEAIEVSDGNIQFITDKHSINEAKIQIQKSFNTAINSIKKSKNIANRHKFNNVNRLIISVIKCFAENYFSGRMETLRWSDVLYSEEFNKVNDRDEFFKNLDESIEMKKNKYVSLLNGDKEININCKNIQPYWETPEYEDDFNIQIKIIQNKKKFENFFSLITQYLNEDLIRKIKINDTIDIYHLYSLYYDGNISEIWTCNQNFVKKHKKYLKNINEFERLFSEDEVKINYIK